MSRERSPFEWYLSCCSNQVWGGGDPKDAKYTCFAERPTAEVRRPARDEKLPIG